MMSSLPEELPDEVRQMVFAALADPTRRYLIERLTVGSATITELATGLPMSRQAVTKHLDLLEAASLVVVIPQGRERHYTLSLSPLQVATHWIAGVEKQWDERLGRLQQMLLNEITATDEADAAK